jgi:hypothetical protein
VIETATVLCKVCGLTGHMERQDRSLTDFQRSEGGASLVQVTPYPGLPALEACHSGSGSRVTSPDLALTAWGPMRLLAVGKS